MYNMVPDIESNQSAHALDYCLILLILLGYSMFCVGFGIYTRELAPKCIFHNQHKTLCTVRA